LTVPQSIPQTKFQYHATLPPKYMFLVIVNKIRSANCCLIILAVLDEENKIIHYVIISAFSMVFLS